MNSPFKFLDAYTEEDQEIFFGREDEIDVLYNLVNRNRLVLVYGPSGTGKTSLLQCGLGNRFDETDWLPLLIRRGKNMPSSLQNALEEEWDEELEGNFWEKEKNPLPEIIQDIFEEKLRPIYLIFDQLEEIFVLGSEKEREVFTNAISDIYHAKLPCRLLFIIREEYLAHLYVFEHLIPSLFDRRLRVEPMNVQKAKEVILSSCQQFNIEFEDPENNPFQIIEKVSSGKAGVALPYLQVYLDRLYQDDFGRTFPKQEFEPPPPGQAYPKLEFTTKEIHEFGELGAILKSFLNEQMEQIQERLTRDHPRVPSRAVRRVLGSFASLEGTKIPQKLEELHIANLGEKELQEILGELEQARILRSEDGLYELAHDTLAKEIANQRTGEEETVIRIAEMVRSRNQDFHELHTYLNQKEIQRLEDVEELLLEEKKLKDAEWKFVRDSRQHISTQKKRRRARIASVIVALSGLLIVAVAFWVRAQSISFELEDSLKLTRQLLYQEELAKKKAREAQAKADSSLIIAEDRLLDALRFKKNNLELQREKEINSRRKYENASLVELVRISNAKIDSLEVAIMDINSQIEDINGS